MGDSGRSKEEVYTSRKTILDRPCWRDDRVELLTTKQYSIEVYYSNEKDQLPPQLYDEIHIGPIAHMRGKFAVE